MLVQGLFVLQTAFMIWMLVDAIQRRVEYYWFFLIFGLQPIGPWIYFFVVKVHDFDLRGLHGLFQRPVSIARLRYNVRENPCLENKLQLAHALLRAGQHQEAADLYGQALRIDSQDKEALYGYGLCQVQAGDYAGAVNYFYRVVEIDKAFQDYAPWSDLAYALGAAGRGEEAIEQLRRLVEMNPRISHAVLLAQYLTQSAQPGEAGAVLETALEDYANAPPFVRRAYGRWARQARRMLKSLAAGA